MSQRDTVVHLVAGGVAGTVGAIVTCPLEVVKTRLQSSGGGALCASAASGDGKQRGGTGGVPSSSSSSASEQQRRPTQAAGGGPASVGLVRCLRHIVRHEGPMALFKGLGPNLVGVAPSRAVYFCAYSQSKAFLNSHMTADGGDTALVHVLSATCAGFASSTLTNPIWFVKTRLQLDHATHREQMTAVQCIRGIYKQSGILGFYKGITASYFGIAETIVHFVIYEAIKAELLARRSHPNNPSSSSASAAPADSSIHPSDFVEFMAAGAVSKTVASCVAYPHEVARTRLREEGRRYRGFWQTLGLVAREEGVRGVYRGLGTQLVRQIPNTAIVMATYEAVVYALSRGGDGLDADAG